MANLKTGISRKQSTSNFRKTYISYPLICTRVYVCVSGVRNVRFAIKFDVLCFLETPVLRFGLLPYYRRFLHVNFFQLTQIFAASKQRVKQSSKTHLFDSILSVILKDGKNFRPADHGGKFRQSDKSIIRSDLYSLLFNYHVSMTQQTFTCSN